MVVFAFVFDKRYLGLTLFIIMIGKINFNTDQIINVLGHKSMYDKSNILQNMMIYSYPIYIDHKKQKLYQIKHNVI